VSAPPQRERAKIRNEPHKVESRWTRTMHLAGNETPA